MRGTVLAAIAALGLTFAPAAVAQSQDPDQPVGEGVAEPATRRR